MNIKKIAKKIARKFGLNYVGIEDVLVEMVTGNPDVYLSPDGREIDTMRHAGWLRVMQRDSLWTPDAAYTAKELADKELAQDVIRQVAAELAEAIEKAIEDEAKLAEMSGLR